MGREDDGGEARRRKRSRCNGGRKTCGREREATRTSERDFKKGEKIGLQNYVQAKWPVQGREYKKAK